jgi:hypothetical protein
MREAAAIAKGEVEPAAVHQVMLLPRSTTLPSAAPPTEYSSVSARAAARPSG